MKPVFTFLWCIAILILWLLSVWAAFNGGFQPGLITPLPNDPYPWKDVVFVSIETAIESAFLCIFLLPNRFSWSISRVGIAFGIFFVLSIGISSTVPTDLPGYAYVLGNFTLLLMRLLFFAFIITIIVVLSKYVWKKVHAK